MRFLHLTGYGKTGAIFVIMNDHEVTGCKQPKTRDYPIFSKEIRDIVFRTGYGKTWCIALALPVPYQI